MVKPVLDMFRIRTRTADYTIVNSVQIFTATFHIFSTAHNVLWSWKYFQIV